VLVEILLVAAIAVVIVAGLIVWIRRAASCARIIDAPGGEAREIFGGGVMCRYVITSGSLARLEFFDWGIRLRGIAVSRWIVPTWEARYDELAIAELVALPWSRIAVWFRLRAEPTGIAFLSDHSQDILGLVEQRGIPVNRSVAKIKRVEELYRAE
jgi:hypothetical protein